MAKKKEGEEKKASTKKTTTKTVKAAEPEPMTEAEVEAEAAVEKKASKAKKFITTADVPQPKKLSEEEIEKLIEEEEAKPIITTKIYNPKAEKIREKMRKTGVITTGDL